MSAYTMIVIPAYTMKKCMVGRESNIYLCINCSPFSLKN